ncbi:MAG TPA: hypothetical protein VFU47_09250, partial [Armatimonadota bacterium]|nr:hypothetical protein [Armatimonadota bacterium]
MLSRGAAVVQHDPAVDQHVRDADGRGERLLDGGGVPDRLGIEKDDIRLHPGFQPSAAGEAHAAGRERGHLADRLFQGEDPLLPDVAPEHAREAAGRARVHAPQARIAAEHGAWVTHEAAEVLLLHRGHDHGLVPAGKLPGGLNDGADDLRGRLAGLRGERGDSLPYPGGVRGVEGEADALRPAHVRQRLLPDGQVLEAPAGGHGRDGGGPEDVRIHVQADVQAVAVGAVDAVQHLRGFPPHRTGGELDVGDLGRNAGLLRNPHQLVEGGEGAVAFIADVADVEAAGRRLRAGGHFFRGRVDAGIVLQAGGEAERAGGHLLADPLPHPVDLFRAGGTAEVVAH